MNKLARKSVCPTVRHPWHCRAVLLLVWMQLGTMGVATADDIEPNQETQVQSRQAQPLFPASVQEHARDAAARRIATGQAPLPADATPSPPPRMTSQTSDCP